MTGCSRWRQGLLGAAFAMSAGLPAVPPEAPQTFDHTHARWTAVLDRHVTRGVVDYAGLARTDGAPGAPVDAYLGDLEAAAGAVASWRRDEQMAYWINAYNAYAIRLILDHYPLKTIRSIGWLPGSAFRRAFIPLGPGNRRISLDDIEHGTLRPGFKDARIHFALVCASTSCPELRSEAYRAADLDAELDEAGRRFLADRQRNHYDPATNTLHLSSIFDWFRADFVRDAGSLEGHVARFLPAQDAEAVRTRRPAIRFLEYDWSLNGR